MARYSIIIPVYNAEKYLDECIKSVIGQSYSDFELILVDDGSTDKSLSLCEQYATNDRRLKVIHKENGGVSSARNCGIKNSSGDWLLFIDSDDYIHERLLENCDKAIATTNAELCIFDFTENSEDILYTNAYSDDVVKKLDKEQLLNLQTAIFNRDRQVVGKDMIKAPSPVKFFKRSILFESNILFFENLITGEDGVFCLYYYQQIMSAVYVQQKLYYYRQHAESVTHRFIPNAAKEFGKLQVAYVDFLNKYPNCEIKKFSDERVILSFSFACISDYCHRNNKKNYSVRKKEFLLEYKNYSEEISRVKLDSFGIKKKVMFCLIKHKAFFFINLLCRCFFAD